IDLLKLAEEKISIENMTKVVNSSPRDADFYYKASSGYFDNGRNEEEYKELIGKNYCLKCLSKGVSKELSASEKIVFDVVWNYWGRDFPYLAEKTRSIITESFLGLAEPFLTGVLREIFSTTTNITPEDTHEGYIIILDFPEKEYLELGVYAQSIFKLLWQQGTQRRDVTPPCRPIFLWIDEAQLFLSERHDMLFQSTARSSKACTVLISQNISNYYSVIGGSNPREQADSLLGNLSTKIFHANNDFVTNKWASDTIGQDLRAMSGINVSGGGDANGTGFHTHETLMPQILPREFTTMKCGGVENDLEVETVITMAGKVWSNGKNHIKAIFRQDA
ncbi:MAG: TraM recognition domain-containing protein, partial [Chitinophagales bacterium]